MKFLTSIILQVILTVIISTWIFNVWPYYGFPLGLGLGLSWVFGFMTKRAEHSYKITE